MAVTPDLEVESLGQRVYDGDSNSVKTTGDLVALVVEFAAGVKLREDDFGRRLAARMTIDGNAATVIDDGDGIVDVNRDVYLVAESCEGFVDRVVDDFVHDVMQAWRARRADVHGRSFSDGLKALEDLDLVGTVIID